MVVKEIKEAKQEKFFILNGFEEGFDGRSLKTKKIPLQDLRNRMPSYTTMHCCALPRESVSGTSLDEQRWTVRRVVMTC